METGFIRPFIFCKTVRTLLPRWLWIVTVISTEPTRMPDRMVRSSGRPGPRLVRSKRTLHTFINGQDGGSPIAGLAVDQDGNLYGATIHGGQNFGGVVYGLSHSGWWVELNAIYSLSGNGGPWSGLTLDDAGNLYGATCFDGHYQLGNVFELSPGQNGWIYSDLHSFSEADHASCPIAGVTVAPDGTLYGTASDIVWKIAR